MTRLNTRLAAALTTAMAAALLALAAGCASNASRMETASKLDHILATPMRSEAERARDQYRHPKETLLFFGLRPEMSVVEITPNPGWYTEIIAPLMRERGRYFAALPAQGADEYGERELQQFRTLISGWPQYLDQVQIVPFVPGQPIAEDGSADLVVTFRNLHNWMARDTLAGAIASMYRVLKPGGVLGVVEHRGNASVAQDPRARSGYVNQAFAIQQIEAAGFKLVATSEINANPKDTKDYPRGVWTLPPTLAEGEKDRAKFQAIGESDRFTLKFVKPR